MFTWKDLKTEKRFLITWITTCLVLSFVLITLSSINRAEILGDTQTVGEARTQYQLAQQEMSEVVNQPAAAISTFHLENLAAITFLPQSKFYMSSNNMLQTASVRLENMLADREKYIGAIDKMSSALMDIDRQKVILEASEDEDLGMIAQKISLTAKDIDQWISRSSVSAPAAQEQEFFTNLVADTEADLEVMHSGISELQPLMASWKNILTSSEDMISVDKEFQASTKEAMQSLTALGIRINQDYTKQMDYASHSNRMISAGLLFLFFNLMAAVIMAFKSRHYGAMVGRDEMDAQKAELANITEQLDRLNALSTQTWLHTAREASLLDTAMETSEDIKGQLAGLGESAKHIVEEDMEDLQTVLGGLESMTDKADLHSEDLRPMITRLKTLSENLQNRESALSNGLQNVNRTESSLMSEMQKISQAVTALRKETLALKNQGNDVEESSNYLSSTF